MKQQDRNTEQVTKASSHVTLKCLFFCHSNLYNICCFHIAIKYKTKKQQGQDDTTNPALYTLDGPKQRRSIGIQLSEKQTPSYLVTTFLSFMEHWTIPSIK
jgi:hypothetical protein